MVCWCSLDTYSNDTDIIECIVHGSKNGLLYDLTYFGAKCCCFGVRRFSLSATGLVHIADGPWPRPPLVCKDDAKGRLVSD